MRAQFVLMWCTGGSSLYRCIAIFVWLQQAMVLVARGYEPLFITLLFVCLVSQFLLHHRFSELSDWDAAASGSGGGDGSSSVAVYSLSIFIFHTLSYFVWVQFAFFTLNDLRTGEFPEYRQPFSLLTLLYREPIAGGGGGGGSTPLHPAYDIVLLVYLSIAPLTVLLVWSLWVVTPSASKSGGVRRSGVRRPIMIRSRSDGATDDDEDDSPGDNSDGDDDSGGGEYRASPRAASAPAVLLRRPCFGSSSAGGVGIVELTLTIVVVVFGIGIAPIAHYCLTHIHISTDPAGAAWAATGRDILRLALYSFAAIPLGVALLVVCLFLLLIWPRA